LRLLRPVDGRRHRDFTADKVILRRHAAFGDADVVDPNLRRSGRLAQEPKVDDLGELESSGLDGLVKV
jgi:hypothetical protein